MHFDTKTIIGLTQIYDFFLLDYINFKTQKRYHIRSLFVFKICSDKFNFLIHL